MATAKKTQTPIRQRAALTSDSAKTKDPRDDAADSSDATEETAQSASAAAQAASTVAPDASVAPRPRKKTDVMVKVKPTKGHINITQQDGTMHSYPAGTTEMPESDAKHWYAEAHGVEIDE